MGFEEVAAENSDGSSDSDSDEEEEDEEGSLEVAALGAMLLRKKIRKEELIDACYHRCPRHLGGQMARG
jgi:hypothetical protein